MTTAPYTAIRLWVRDYLDEGGKPETAIDDALTYFLDKEAFVQDIAAAVVEREAKNQLRMTGNPVSTPERTAPAIPPSVLPVPQTKQNIIVDMASMRRIDLMNWAAEKRNRGDKEYDDAAFLVAVASELGQDEQVKERFDVDALHRIRNRVQRDTQHRIYLGNRLINLNALPKG